MARTIKTRTKAEKSAAARKPAPIRVFMERAKHKPARKLPGFLLPKKRKPKTKARPYQYFKVPLKTGRAYKFRSRCNPKPGTICHAASAYIFEPKDVADYTRGALAEKGAELKVLGFKPSGFK